MEQYQDKADLETYSRSPSESIEIAKIVRTYFKGMDTFGKTSTDLPSIIELFDFALSRYNIVDIKKAFGVYLNSNTNFPKPADIIKIIDPPKEWCLQKFLAIKEEKALGKFILSKDEEYYKSYLNRDLKGW